MEEEEKGVTRKAGANCSKALYMKAAKKTPAPIRAPAPTLTLAAAPVEEAAAELADPEAEDAREEAEELAREAALEPEDAAAAAPDDPEAEAAEPEPVAAITAALRIWVVEVPMVTTMEVALPAVTLP